MIRMLDLFCGAGGCASGYHKAGIHSMTGVDIKPQRRYPFHFIQGDALEYLRQHGHEYDVIHASPPCQRYSKCKYIHGNGADHPDLLGPTRELLATVGKLWVIENVPGAPMTGAIVLCGMMFGLGVLRHRQFESSLPLSEPKHPRHPSDRRTRVAKGGYSSGKAGLVCVAGNNFNHAAGAKAMGIDWMDRRELAQAIPPAYTEWIGKQIVEHLRDRGEPAGTVGGTRVPRGD